MIVMDFKLSPETESILNMVSEFSRKKIEPIANKIDSDEFDPKGLFREMGSLGILGITVPEEYGGANLDYLTQGLILEELSYYSASIGLSYGAHSNLVMDNLNRNGSKHQKERYLDKMSKGELIGSLCLTEPGAGSDAIGSMKTTYNKMEDEKYKINGSKIFITNAPIADLFLTYARNGSIYSAFLLERADGVETPKKLKKMGMRGSPTGEVVFNDIVVGKDRLMGNEGDGRRIIMSGLNSERAVLAFGPLGIARRALEDSINYSTSREQFGQKIGDFELIQERLAYMFTKLEAARLLAYKAALMTKEELLDPSYAASSILFASETATEITKHAIMIFGGYGYMSEYPLERYHRDALLYEIGAGTNEIRKIIIGHNIQKKRFK
jgi:Acyl-CoA dehydrogenases